MVVGITFGRPIALARCISNAHNALVHRHLATPQNKINILIPNYLLTILFPILRPRYFQALTQNLEGQWRVGRGQAKLEAIDHSKIFHEAQWHKAKSFVKFEVGVSMPTKARLIQGNQNEFTAYEYPEEYAAFSEALKEAIEFEHSGVTFKFQYAGGCDHDQLSEMFTDAYMSAGAHVIIDERDGKNWDSTMQYETLKCEGELYEALGMSAAEAFFARASGVKGTISYPKKGWKSFISYVTRWKRLSGDWDTSVGNSLISMLITIFTIVSLPQHLRPLNVFALFMGDDYLGVYRFAERVAHVDLKLALDHYEALCGITPMRGLFTDPLLISFISLGLWPRHEGGYQFVPHPARQLVKLFSSVRPLAAAQLDDYQTSLSIAFWPVYWGWPLMMKFLKKHYTKPTTKMTCQFYFHRMLTGRCRHVDWCSGFVAKYEIPFVSTHFEVGDALFQRHPVVDHMLRFENADPAARSNLARELKWSDY